ncbi:MAG: S8 family peptidase [Bdellovibrionota bacterium]
MKSVLLRAAALFACALTVGSYANAKEKRHAYKVAPGYGFVTAQAALGDAKVIDSIPRLGIIVVDGETEIMSSKWRSLGEVGQVSISPFGPDTERGMWGMRAIEAPAAWGRTQGEGIVVAVSDTGVQTQNPDLHPNLWRNAGEIAGNAKDDDGNGYVDDVYGWDFSTNGPAYKDNHYHGTHVAGTIAAVPGTRIVGMAPKAMIMSATFITSSGSGSSLNAAKSIVYAVDNGAKLINCSWGGAGKDSIVDEAVAYAEKKGVLLIVAAGNDSKNDDRTYFSPASNPSATIVSVGATSSAKGTKSSFSNWGLKNVDLAAPGSDILSASPNKSKTSYQLLSGTSMATPHVSGVVALVWSLKPSATSQEIKEIIMKSAVPASAWKGKSVTGGVLNAKAAVALVP